MSIILYHFFFHILSPYWSLSISSSLPSVSRKISFSIHLSLSTTSFNIPVKLYIYIFIPPYLSIYLYLFCSLSISFYPNKSSPFRWTYIFIFLTSYLFVFMYLSMSNVSLSSFFWRLWPCEGLCNSLLILLC